MLNAKSRLEKIPPKADAGGVSDRLTEELAQPASKIAAKIAIK